MGLRLAAGGVHLMGGIGAKRPPERRGLRRVRNAKPAQRSLCLQKPAVGIDRNGRAPEAGDAPAILAVQGRIDLALQDVGPRHLLARGPIGSGLVGRVGQRRALGRHESAHLGQVGLHIGGTDVDTLIGGVAVGQGQKD
jgi:hypothetical protein